MSRRDDRAREAIDLAAAETAADLAAAAFPLPAIHGTTVKTCLDMGEGAAIVHDAAGVYVVDAFDPEAAFPTVLATYDELHEQVDAGARPVDVAKLLVIREKKALMALRQHVGFTRGGTRQAVAA